MPKNKQPEAELQKAFWRWLSLTKRRDVVAFHVPNGGRRSPIEASIMKSMGVLPGVPDMVMVWQGQAYFLELKAKKGKLTPIQVMMGEDLLRAGARVATAYSLDEAMHIVRSWDLIRLPMRVLAETAEGAVHG